MIYVVAGFGRCGTSLMMQCLQASGIEPYYDKLLEATLLKNNRADYTVNKAFLECNSDDYMKLGFGKSIPEGRAVKIALRGIPLLSGGRDYRVVMMDRHPDSIRKSFIASELVKDFDDRFPHWPNFYYDVRGEIEGLIAARRDMQCVKVGYADLMENPVNVFTRIQKIVPIDIDAAMNVIDPTMYRHVACSR